RTGKKRSLIASVSRSSGTIPRVTVSIAPSTPAMACWTRIRPMRGRASDRLTVSARMEQAANPSAPTRPPQERNLPGFCHTAGARGVKEGKEGAGYDRSHRNEKFGSREPVAAHPAGGPGRRRQLLVLGVHGRERRGLPRDRPVPDLRGPLGAAPVPETLAAKR